MVIYHMVGLNNQKVSGFSVILLISYDPEKSLHSRKYAVFEIKGPAPGVHILVAECLISICAPGRYTIFPNHTCLYNT